MWIELHRPAIGEKEKKDIAGKGPQRKVIQLVERQSGGKENYKRKVKNDQKGGDSKRSDTRIKRREPEKLGGGESGAV